MTTEVTSLQNLQASLINIAVESWRFQRVFANAISKLDPIEQNKYFNQYLYFFNKVESSMQNADIRIVNVEGQKYDIGLPITPLNLDEFGENDILEIEQMIEPILMISGKLAHQGTVILRKTEQ